LRCRLASYNATSFKDWNREMPKASDELRKWKRWGRQGSVGQQKPMTFLERQGYVLTERWGWRKPSPSHVVSAQEADAIQYLIHEWDFAGLEE
jgi:hypothetical protein